MTIMISREDLFLVRTKPVSPDIATDKDNFILVNSENMVRYFIRKLYHKYIPGEIYYKKNLSLNQI